MMDRLRILFCSGRGAVRLSPDVVVPIGLVPGMILLAATSPIWTAVTFITVPLCGCFLSAKSRERNPRTPVYMVWALCSAIFLLAVMELEVIPYMEIYLWENLLLKVFVGGLLWSIYEMRKAADGNVVDTKSSSVADPENVKKCSVCNFIQARSSHCRYCGYCIVQRDHHCFWVDTCIGARNHRIFILGLVCLICANYYGAMLTLTTVCQPILLLDFFLFPVDCSGVYDDIHLAVCFVSGLYAAVIAAVGVCSLVKQMYLVSVNVTMEEWRRSKSIYSQNTEQSVRRSHSLLDNWRLFLRGQR